jgi:pyruvate dehydrogenase E2 component (dihydrolipoamide acetyltransferase)
MASEIKLQELKENVETVEVNAVKVAVGEVVAKDQPLLEVQADKAALEVPSPMAGRVTQINVKVGDQVKIGQTYCLIEATSGNGENKPAPAKVAEPAKVAAKANAPAVVPPSRLPEPVAPTVAPRAEASLPPSGSDAYAGPATRRLARELGVDLQQVRGSGRNGRILEDDVKGFVRGLSAGSIPLAAPVAGGAPAAPPLPRFEEWGPVERQPLTAIRKLTARQMSLAWSLIPHVTQHDLADITDLEAFRKEQSGNGPKLTVTAFALKAVAILLREFPDFNATLDSASGQLVLKRYYHLGVAVDTPTGLLVPVLRDVDKKSITHLAEELNAVAARVREKKIDPNELKGGTFTITNLGGIGGTGFTPIVNWPEVAILGLSRSRLEPVVRNGQVVPRLMLPLSLSYDHRVIDGAAAARFTRRLAELLENPLLMLLKA